MKLVNMSDLKSDAAGLPGASPGGDTKMQIIEYVSIEKQMILDAQKYIERAEMYLAIGKTGHCVGCLVKAAKKLHKAEQFHMPLDITYVIKPMLDNLAKCIADSILNS